MTSAPGQNGDLQAVARGWRAWATESALPFWADAGFDARLGGFHERLRLDGSPDRNAVRRTVVQARQIYVYAHAAVLGWYPEGKDRALDGLDFLLRRVRSPDGAPGYVHLIAPDGSVHDPRRDTYDHAFILLGLAWLARASGDAQVRALIDTVLAFIDEHLAAGDGSFYEGFPRSEPRRQNPHMHLFEAMLALHEAVRHPEALARADTLRGLMETKFIAASTGTLTEFFTADWQPWPGRSMIEPGHHAEWSWLLRRHDRMRAASMNELPRRLLDVALRCAHAPTGLLPDEAAPDATACAVTHRCWPQVELAKAWLAEHEATASVDAGASAAVALENVRKRYLAAPAPGGWFDTLDTSGRPMGEFMPASTFYHLFSAAADVMRVCEPPAA